MDVKKHFGRVYCEILDKIELHKSLVFVVLDPPKQSPEVAGRIALVAEEAGIDAIAVGGSVGAQGKLLDDTIQRIKENCSLRVILFPGNIATLSKKADAIYFMSMLNSLDPYYISGAQTASAFPLKESGVEPIPSSYIIIEPGRAAGWIGRAKPIPREMPYLAGITALAGQYLGSHLVMLESGGGAARHAPLDMISYTKKMVDVPVLVAGGIKTHKDVFLVAKAGADIQHIGTAFEHEQKNILRAKEKMRKMVEAARKGGMQR